MKLCRNRFKHRDTEIQSFLFCSYSINSPSVSMFHLLYFDTLSIEIIED